MMVLAMLSAIKTANILTGKPESEHSNKQVNTSEFDLNIE